MNLADLIDRLITIVTTGVNGAGGAYTEFEFRSLVTKEISKLEHADFDYAGLSPTLSYREKVAETVNWANRFGEPKLVLWLARVLSNGRQMRVDLKKLVGELEAAIEPAPATQPVAKPGGPPPLPAELTASAERLYHEFGLAAAFSVQSAGTTTTPLEAGSLEVIIARNPLGLELAEWRERMVAAETQVCRVEVGGEVLEGTGFLVGPDVLLTCYHVVERVIKEKNLGAIVRCRFDYRGLASGATEGLAVPLHPTDWLLDYSPYAEAEVIHPDTSLPTTDELDYALLRLARPIGSQPRDAVRGIGPERGWIEVPDKNPSFVQGMPCSSCPTAVVERSSSLWTRMA